MKLNDELIKNLHVLLGDTYAMTLIFDKEQKQPMCGNLIGLRKSKKGAYISLFDDDEEFEAIPQKNLIDKIKDKTINKPTTGYLG